MEDFLNKNIIKDVGLDGLPEEKQKEAMLKIGAIIFQGVLSKVFDELEDEEAKEFENLITNNPDDEEAIMSFLNSKVSNLDDIVKEEIERFKRESVDFMSKIG